MNCWVPDMSTFWLHDAHSLWWLREPGTEQKLSAVKYLQPAVGEMRSILDEPARRQKLRMHLPWLEIAALVLQHQSSGETLAGFPLLNKSPKLDEIISEALRYIPECLVLQKQPELGCSMQKTTCSAELQIAFWGMLHNHTL